MNKGSSTDVSIHVPLGDCKNLRNIPGLVEAVNFGRFLYQINSGVRVNKRVMLKVNVKVHPSFPTPRSRD